MTGPTATKTSRAKNPMQAKQRTQEPMGRSTVSGSYGDILALQDAAGNRAVSQSLQAGIGVQSTSANGMSPTAKSVLKSTTPDLEQGTSWVDLEAPDGHVASIYFPTNQASLDTQDKLILLKIYNAYTSYLGLWKVILRFIGYADYRGTEQYNLDLGYRRAKTVSEYFSPLASSPNYISSVESKGESELPQPGTTSVELNPYRRVDIIASPIIKSPSRELHRPAEDKMTKRKTSTKFMIRVNTSVSYTFFVGGDVVAFEVFDIENNRDAFFLYLGGSVGVNLKRLPGAGATGWGSWTAVTTSKPIQLEDFEGRAEHGSAGIVLGIGGQMEHLYLHGPERVNAEQVKVGWIGLSKGLSAGVNASVGKAWLTGGLLDLSPDYLRK